jgi:hypothetical protein
MFAIWQKNIHASRKVIHQNKGPLVATVVSGSRSDQHYWRQRLAALRRDLFRADETSTIISVHEQRRKGNFLGTLQAWRETANQLATQHQPIPDLALMSMVFGQGKRLSPFTQALGNRKPAFLTPLKSSDGQHYLTTADVACASSAMLFDYLQTNGFRGLIVKWGDEAIIPGTQWEPLPDRFCNVDAIRFVWLTEPTPELAREKDWVVSDAATGLMKFQYSRQERTSLQQRIAALGEGEYHTGVNLGSLAISDQFLNVAQTVFGADTASPDHWIDWDPYVWIALFCPHPAQWRAEAEEEARLGRSGIRELEARYPDFYPKVQQVRRLLEQQTGRPFAVATLDFGQPYWMDWGLHTSLRKTLQSLTADSVEGMTAREIFQIPHERDQRGNILLDSQIPDRADIRNSVIIDTVITDPASVVHDGVVIAGRHRRLTMPDGGAALFCAADQLTFAGPHGIAFRAAGADIVVPAGGRYTTLCLSSGLEPIVSNEALTSYEGANYTEARFANKFSFEQATQLIAAEDVHALEERWQQLWSNWLR